MIPEQALLMRFISCLLLLLLPCVSWAEDMFDPDAQQPAIDFLYINANAGEAAGGHTALRLGDAVFHYQFFPDDTFLLVRESWDSFRFLYNDLHNRSISIATLPLERSTQLTLRNHFTELLAGQQQFFDAFSQAQREKRFFESLLSGKYDFAVKGLGFFQPPPVDHLESSGLRTYIAMLLGEDYLSNGLKRADRCVREIIQEINRGNIHEQKLLEALSFREALRVLVQDWQLDGQALIPAMVWEEPLNDGELVKLQQFADYLQQSIIGLLQSNRPDRGETLLLQTARYLAVHQSLATLKLASLDPFYEDVHSVELDDEDIDTGKLTHLQDELRQQAVRRRDLFLQESQHPEISCSLFEMSRAKAWELSRVSADNRSVRILVKPVLPGKLGIVRLENVHPDSTSLRAGVDRLGSGISALYHKQETQYGYNLVYRNCATELIRSLHSGFPNPKTGEAILGGWLEADSGLLFIPFIFYNQVTSTFSINTEMFLAARRLRNLEKLYESEDDLWVWLRESNTLTSTLYEPRTKDTPFLFFTDDSFLLRPLLGIFNVGYATLHGAAALFTLPIDGGKHLTQAGRGIFYSLPELTFGNIRKGSYPLGDDMARP